MLPRDLRAAGQGGAPEAPGGGSGGEVGEDSAPHSGPLDRLDGLPALLYLVHHGLPPARLLAPRLSPLHFLLLLTEHGLQFAAHVLVG